MKLLSPLSYLAAGLSAFLLVRPKAPPASVLLWLPRMYAQALAPLLAAMGAIAVVIGIRRRAWGMAAAGVTASALAARYLHSVSAYHNAFAEAFGGDWEQRLPEDLQPQLVPPRRPLRRWQIRPRRWTPMRGALPLALHQPDIVYGRHPATDTPLLADLWQPPARLPRSGLGVIYVHGGAWRRGDKDMGTRTFFRRLAGQGHVVMDIAYTLADDTRLETMVGDVKRAILWFKAHAADYGVDPERIVLIGGSAGGHLALVAAYTPNHPAFQPGPDAGDAAVRAVVALYPPTDLFGMYEETQSAYGHLLASESAAVRLKDKILLTTFTVMGFLPSGPEGKRNNYIAHLLGGAPDEIPGIYELLSPIRLLGPHCPPTLLLQGAGDFFKFSPAVRHLHEALRAAGATSVFIEYPHADHAFDLVLPQISPVAQAAIYDIERFLALMV